MAVADIQLSQFARRRCKIGRASHSRQVLSSTKYNRRRRVQIVAASQRSGGAAASRAGGLEMAFADQRAHAAEMPAATHASAWALASGAGAIPGRGWRGRRSLHVGHLLCCCHSRRAARAGCWLHRAQSWTGPKQGPGNAMPKAERGGETPVPRGSGGEPSGCAGSI